MYGRNYGTRLHFLSLTRKKAAVRLSQALAGVGTALDGLADTAAVGRDPAGASSGKSPLVFRSTVHSAKLKAIRKRHILKGKLRKSGRITKHNDPVGQTAQLDLFIPVEFGFAANSIGRNK